MNKSSIFDDLKAKFSTKPEKSALFTNGSGSVSRPGSWPHFLSWEMTCFLDFVQYLGSFDRVKHAHTFILENGNLWTYIFCWWGCCHLWFLNHCTLIQTNVSLKSDIFLLVRMLSFIIIILSHILWENFNLKTDIFFR